MKRIWRVNLSPSSLKVSGVILSRHWADKPSADAGKPASLDLEFWLTSNLGPIKLVLEKQLAVFFIETQGLENAINCLQRSTSLKSSSWFTKSLDLRSFTHQPISAIYFHQQRALYTARQLLRENAIEILEADVQPTERFLMERFVTSVMSVTGVPVQRHRYTEIRNPRIEREHTAQQQNVPSLRVLSLDIETSMDGKRLFSIASYCHHYHASGVTDDGEGGVVRKIFMLGSSQTERVAHTVFCASEKSLLHEFLHWFEGYDPDIIIGWSVINFDLRFLQRKADLLNIPLTMGRDRQLLDWRQGRDDKEYFTLTLPGRAVLDGIDTLKSATYSFESFSLQNVSNVLLNRGKLIHDVDNRGQEIGRLFEQDKAALAKYNLEDCRLVWDIFAHTDLINFALARANLTGLALDRFGGSVAAFDNRYLPRLHRSGFVAPALRENPPGVGSPGGYVMDSEPGLYDNVLVLDFKSLYPSIIRTFNIDPLALAEGTKNLAKDSIDGFTEDEAEGCTESTVADIEDFVAGFNGAIFDRSSRILPNLIEELWQSRDKAKRDNNAAMSQAIKILMNSFYGVMGTPGCRFFDARLPSSITLRGHQILNETREFIVDEGHRVIYGDTDSLFVWLKDLPAGTGIDDIFTLGERLVDKLNAWWREKLKTQYAIDSALELEFETYFSRFVMPTIRGSEAGSKKRYAGRKVSKDQANPDELIFKGLEAVRTDWTALARRFQRELYRRIFFDQPYKDYVRDVVKDIYAGKYDSELVYRKRLRRDLDDYEKNVPPHVQAARLGESLRREKGRSRRYRRGSWIEYVHTLSGPEPADMARAGIDYERYVERQIAPIVDGIVHFLDTSFEEIAGQQLGLF